MYKVSLYENQFDILYNDQKVLKGILPFISLDGGDSYTPEFKFSSTLEGQDSNGTYIEHMLCYGDEEHVDLKLSVKCYEGLLAVYVDAFQKVDVFKATQGLLPIGGIKLQVKDIGETEGLMANYMFSNWWTRPYFSKEISSIPPRTNSILWKDNEVFHHMLPLCSHVFKSEFQGNGSGMDVVISSYAQGHRNCSAYALLLGSGGIPFEVSERITEAGFNILNNGEKMREGRRYPKFLEYLGWCSWDAFYHDVNSKGILDKAEEFKNLGLPLRWMIVDDGWSEYKDKKLFSFKEDRSKFPEGLRGLIDTLKSNHGIGWVGVWQAFTGYWNGIHPDSELSREMKDNLLHANNGLLLPYPDASKGFGFWNSWHKYLKKQGVDFVKIDNQSSAIVFYRDNAAVGKAARETHEALEASVGINFDNNIINCMGMGMEDIWNRPVSSVSRNSDDFYPRRENSFKEHALQNAYNSFYHGNFMWGDWDMWWTTHEQDVNNAVLRAVSGGPLYVSDGVGKTDASKLWPLILKDGSILRCDRPGMPTAECLVHNPYDEAVPLKIWNTCGNCGVVGVFNINANKETVKGTVSPVDIPGLDGERFVIYSHFNKKAIVAGRNEKIQFELGDNGVDLYLIIPVSGRITPIGLTNKYISNKTIEFFKAFERKSVVLLKEGGIFSYVSNAEPSAVIVNGVKKDAKFANGVYSVDCTDLLEKVHIEVIM